MNAINNIERTLEEWGQNLRGGTSAHGLQPKDVLQTVLKSLEANRVEGLDHRIYAPNSYTVELRLEEEERSRLLPFVNRDELEDAIQRYCQERKYHFRGPLALQVVEAPASATADYPQETNSADTRDGSSSVDKKVVVQSRFDVPKDWDSDLARQFVMPAGHSASEHDAQRRETSVGSPPTYQA